MTSVQWNYSAAIKSQTVNTSASSVANEKTTNIVTRSQPKSDVLDLSKLSRDRYDAAIAAAQAGADENVEESKPTSLWVKGQKTDKEYFGTLAKFLGISDEAEVTKTDFLSALKQSIKSEGRELQGELNSLFKKNDISLGRHDRLTFRFDNDGNFVIAGLKNQRTLDKVVKAVNAQPELLADLKSLAAKQQVYDAAQNDELEATMQDSFALRQQLTNDYLASQNKKASLADYQLNIDEETGEQSLVSTAKNRPSLAGSLAGLDLEIAELLQGPVEKPKLSRETESLLKQLEDDQKQENVDFAYKNGVIMNETIYDQQQVNRDVKTLAINPFPGKIRDPEAEAFTIIMRQDGRFRVDEIKTENGLEKVRGVQPDVAFDEEFAQQIVDDVLQKHQYDYGDVYPNVNGESYAHEIKLHIGTGPNNSDYEIISSGAEAAAEANIRQGMIDLSRSLGEYLKSTFTNDNATLSDEQLAGILSQPLEFLMTEDGELTFDRSAVDNEKYADLIEQTLNRLNERIASNDPLADEEFEDLLDDPNLQDALHAMIDLKHNFAHLQQKNKNREQTVNGLKLSITPLA